MNLQLVLAALIHPFKSEHDLILAIEELSLKFTQNRDKIGDYLKDPRLVSAYTAFYLTTNMPKLAAVFEWLPEEFLNELKGCDLIDLGSGPGTFSLAWQEWGGEELTGSTIQVETSALMREQGKKLWESFSNRPLVQLERWSEQPLKPRFLLFGHSANEMGPSLVMQYIEKIKPDHVLFIEPGTKSFFPEMLKIRDALLSQGYHILYPCPLETECPMRGSSEDWCHQFIHVSHPPELERLTQMAKRDRKLLSLIVHVFSRTFQKENPHERIVRVLPETKFSFEWEVCVDNQLEKTQVMKRNLSKIEMKTLESTLAGSSLESSVEKKLEQSRRVTPITLNNRPLKP